MTYLAYGWNDSRVNEKAWLGHAYVWFELLNHDGKYIDFGPKTYEWFSHYVLKRLISKDFGQKTMCAHGQPKNLASKENILLIVKLNLLCDNYFS